MIDLNNYERKVFSQHGEDGITLKLVECLYPENYSTKYYVEFGVQSGAECNTRILKQLCTGWEGLLMDGGYEDPALNLKKEVVTKENVITLFQKYNVPKHINLLSIDIDYNDFYCAKEILKYYTCDILIFEYNGTHDTADDKIVVYSSQGSWDGYSNYFGASLLSWSKLTAKYNYSLVCCDSSGTNCYFVHNNILKTHTTDFVGVNDLALLYRAPTYGPGPNGGHRQDPNYRRYLSFEEAYNA